MVDIEAVLAMRKQGQGLDRNGFPWEAKELDALLEMYEMGIGITEIAVSLQRTETAVVQQLVKRNSFRDEREHRDTPGNNCRCSRCRQQSSCTKRDPDSQSEQGL